MQTVRMRDASRRLKGILGRSARLGVDPGTDLQSVTLLRQACGVTDQPRYLMPLLLLLTLVLMVCCCLRLVDFYTACDITNKTEEIHIQTMRWDHSEIYSKDSHHSPALSWDTIDSEESEETSLDHRSLRLHRER